MSKEIVLVTGSSGLIGHEVVRRLCKDYDVIGFDTIGHPEPLESDTIIVNLESDESVQNAFHLLVSRHGLDIASVVHLAAFYDFSGDPSPKYDQVTVNGTGRMLRELQRFNCEQFIFSSSMLVHAPCLPGQKISETWPLEPKWAYPISKVKTEELIKSNRGLIPAAILRIAGCYNSFCHSIPIAHQMQRIYEKRLLSHLFPGDLSHGQSFIHLDDLVESFAGLISRRHQLANELTLLIGEPDVVSYGRLQSEFGRLMFDENWITETVPKPMAKAGAWLQGEIPSADEPFIKPWMIDIADDHYDLDVSKARETIGFRPKNNLLDALPSMVAALEADPVRFYEINKLVIPNWLKNVQPKKIA